MPAAINGLRVVFLAGFVASFGACAGEPAATVTAAEPARLNASAASAATAIPTSLDSVAQQTAKPASAQTAPRTTASTAKPVQDGLPELVYVCPMPQDLDAVSDKPGKCVKCGMELFGVRLKQVWSCLSNTAFLSKTPGKCKTDGTEMQPVNASIFWTCQSTPDKKELSPGKCADGTNRVEKMEVFVHGDHNPKHGGTLFMAPDGWHHIEGTHPSAGLVRAFFYDEFTRPLAAKAFSATAVVKDAAGKDVSTIPMKGGRIASALEAQIPGAKLPLSVQLRVHFKPGDKETRFDFHFPEYSKEPAPTTTTTAKPATTTTTTTARPAGQPPSRSASAGQGPAGSASAGSTTKPVATAPKPAPAAPPSAAVQTPAALPGTTPPQESGADPMRQQQTLEIVPDKMIEIPVLPNTSKELLAELKTSSEDVKALIDEGGNKIREVWVPALRTKEIALKLGDYLNDIPERQRPVATSAINRIMRSAWEMDDLGDLGDNEKILVAYHQFMAAVNELTTSYESVR